MERGCLEKQRGIHLVCARKDWENILVSGTLRTCKTQVWRPWVPQRSSTGTNWSKLQWLTDLYLLWIWPLSLQKRKKERNKIQKHMLL